MAEPYYIERQRRWLCDGLVREVPGVDQAYAGSVYDRVIDTFLRESGSWIENRDFWCDDRGNVRADFSDLGAETMTIHRVRHQGRPVPFASDPPPEYLNTPGNWPRVYSATPYPDVISLLPLPREGDNYQVNIRASVVLNLDDRPKAPIPDWLFTRYKDTLRDGVLSELMLETGKAYSNPNMGLTRARRFKNGTSMARDQAKRSFGSHESEWFYPQGFSA